MSEHQKEVQIENLNKITKAVLSKWKQHCGWKYKYSSEHSFFSWNL